MLRPCSNVTNPKRVHVNTHTRTLSFPILYSCTLFIYTVVRMLLNISELKNRIRQDIRIINNPDGAAELLDVSVQMLRKQFRQEGHDRLWMFILKEKVEHFLENLHPYPTEENRQFSNPEKVI